MEYDNTNSGALFRNNKRANERAPEFTGNINVDGVEKRIAAWVKESRAGNKFFSIKVSDPIVAGEDNPKPKPQDDPVDEEIPF